MEITLDNPKLYDLIAEKGRLIENGRVLTEQIERLEKERYELAGKIQKVKDRVIPLISAEMKPHLTEEFEEIEKAEIKDGKLIVTTFNQLEEFKKRYREAKKKKRH